ncbi:DUF4307 domain-containing protein [Labedella endophytica]|jgi:hypothetical protein|uniref:DUF4307 domain-containing protein n=1 Tax=Labedella endophytica TaxID=1523160 RepID=A0A433JRA7_9MICO|nr:DUF4307 domain-containing protein [Labedella endophytica]RUQ99192.1 DUF4307 domain-containing protein [Labedella endophytica]
MTDTQTPRTAAEQTRPASETSPRPDLESRYGRGTRSRMLEKRILWILGGIIAIVFAAWVVLVAFDGTSATLETRDVAHEIIDEHSVRVSFSLNVAPGTATACAVQALNEDHAIVGWKVIEVPPSTDRNRVITETVLTSQQSNTGLIYSCWLT